MSVRAAAPFPTQSPAAVAGRRADGLRPQAFHRRRPRGGPEPQPRPCPGPVTAVTWGANYEPLLHHTLPPPHPLTSLPFKNTVFPSIKQQSFVFTPTFTILHENGPCPGQFMSTFFQSLSVLVTSSHLVQEAWPVVSGWEFLAPFPAPHCWQPISRKHSSVVQLNPSGQQDLDLSVSAPGHVWKELFYSLRTHHAAPRQGHQEAGPQRQPLSSPSP